MRYRPAAAFKPVYRVAVRHWLHVKFMSPDMRVELATQGLVWLAMLVLLAWGTLGLVAGPL